MERQVSVSDKLRQTLDSPFACSVKLFQSVGPGRIKCLRAPSHQILAKSAPPKARNRDKVEFATKVRKSNINCCLTMNIKKAFNTSLLTFTLSE